ncbi:unnamed protein product [Protopolystoma xenopodis]|uniref:omega-amidase n=1 Tax=Protopolystoma xenopodis TaxID=117903 RepID=A0A3S5B8B7_9PLAT|nr:unnamed protein product [Protopolystoma xenopodis]
MALGLVRLGMIQMRVVLDKSMNLTRATELISSASVDKSGRRTQLICLPECFNSPYGAKYFDTYAEPVPHGLTCKKIAEAARKNKVWVLAGSIPERGDDGKIYNTSVTFDSEGNCVGTFRKLHLFDIDVPGKESSLKFNLLVDLIHINAHFILS